MHVASILNSKGRNVEAVGPETTLKDVVEKLTTKRIGAVIVSATKDDLAGIVSERDIVNALARHGPAILDRPITEVMTRDVVTCKENDSVDHVMAVMTERRFRHVPVIANNRVAGLVSIGDVVKHRLAQIEHEANAMRDYIATA
ncbi:MAG: CBS domain-containing protein [Hyphomicrobiaceae bacterium]